MTRAPRNDAAPGYTVGAVADRLGVPTSTLRSWTQRYGIGPRAHRPGQHRLYTETDIAALERMVALIRRGAGPASAADAVRQALPGDLPTSGMIDADILNAVVDAAERLDTATLVTLIDRTLQGHGVVATWNHLCRPAFQVVEKRQHIDGGCVDIEHALSWAVSTSLARVDQTQTGITSAHVLLACTPGEFHSLPLEALRAALSARGVAVHMIGPDVPTDAVRDALRRTKAATAVIWSHTRSTADPVALDLAGRGERIYAAGPGWDAAHLPSGVSAIDDLDDALIRLLSRPTRF
ncbi:MerR family transcriptional regulator [Nocardia vinacea]|uniref:MerR family transcriptional regulator n=1 Tax=Nocardia vinacea TaxID=96468 RepID=UPI0033F3976F